MADDRPGIPFQAFVARLEGIISKTEGVTVESSKRLIDKDTGRLREHDVVITRRDAHHVITTAIECKDTGRKVGVPVIEAFWKKCERTGINHRLIVSAKGFTTTARKKAEALDVICMELSEASSFEWLAMDGFVRIDHKLGHINAAVFFEGANPPEPFTLCDAANTEMTVQHLGAIVQKAIGIPLDVEKLAGVERPFRVHLNTIGWHGVGADGNRYPVTHVEIETKVTLVRSASDISLHSYEGVGAKYAIASTDVKVGEHEGKQMMIEDGEGIQVVWSPDKPHHG